MAYTCKNISDLILKPKTKRKWDVVIIHLSFEIIDVRFDVDLVDYLPSLES